MKNIKSNLDFSKTVLLTKTAILIIGLFIILNPSHTIKACYISHPDPIERIYAYTNLGMETELDLNNVNTDDTPYFKWGGNEAWNGIAGYYITFGTMKDVDPVRCGSLSGYSEACFQKSNNYSPTIYGDGDYYLNIVVKDNEGNISERRTFTYKYKTPAHSKPDSLNDIKIENITEDALDICWDSTEFYLIELDGIRSGVISSKIAIYESSDNVNYHLKDEVSDGVYKYLPGENKKSPCYTVQSLLPGTTYHFKLYVIFKYTNTSLQSDPSKVVSATTKATSKKCPENSTLAGNECVCNDGYLMSNEQCITHTEDCIRYYGQNVYGEKGNDNNSLCHCIDGYVWNASQTACVKTQIKESPTPELTSKETSEKEEENQQEEQETEIQQQATDTTETTLEKSEQPEQSKENTTEESKPKRLLSILASILSSVKDFFVKLFSLFK